MSNLKRPASPHDHFYPLDNSAVFTAATTGRSSPFVYRISCELDIPVYLPDLETACEKVINRFSCFKTELRPGIFWYYLDPLKRPFKLNPDSQYPAEYHRVKRWGRYLFRVRVYGKRVACEFHHLLTDGTGALEFLKSLIATYLTLRGEVCEDWQGIIRPESPVSPAEFDDAYASHIRKHIPLPDKLPKAYHLHGRRYSGQEYRVTTGTTSLSNALRIAKEKGGTLTEILAAVHLYALQTVAEDGPHAAKHPICIQVPVNLRRLYPSITLRNFFLFVPITLDRRIGHFELDEIVNRAHCTMKLNMNTKEMDRFILRNVGGEEHPVARMTPLAIKNPIIRLIGKAAADKPFSGSISNLGAVTMPEAFARHITRFDFIPPRNSTTGANIGMVSWNDKLSINIGSVVVDRSFEKAFFTTCVQLGIPMSVESNI